MNLVFLVADSLRKDHLGCCGNSWIETPNIDRLAADSVLFEETYPESLPTLPVRNALLSGRYCGPELGWGPMREGDVRLPETLAAAGFTTAFITDVYHMMKPGMNFHRGFHCWRWIRGQEQDPYRTAPNPRPPVPLEYCQKHDPRLVQFCKNVAGFEAEKDYFTARVYETAMQWLEDNYRQGPFFLWIDSFDPHEPWFPPYHYSDLYDPDYRKERTQEIEPIGVIYGDWRKHLAPRQLRRMRAHYAGEVTFLDRCIGRLIGLLRDLRIYDETLIVFISDHGHMLGEHDLIGKNWDTNGYREVMQLVLMIRFPGSEHAGKRIGSLCYNIDVIPTVVSHLGLNVPEQYDGVDLHPLIQGKIREIRKCVTCSYAPVPDSMLVKTLDWTLLYDQRHEPLMLFDRERDPEENASVIADNPGVVEKLAGLETEEWKARPG